LQGTANAQLFEKQMLVANLEQPKNNNQLNLHLPLFPLRVLGAHLRGQSDKYLASSPDGVTIAREIYYRVALDDVPSGPAS